MAVDGSTLADLLERARGGSREATSVLFEQLYDELRQIASRVVGRSARGTLSPTVVLHETWLKFQQPDVGVRVDDRAHFLNLAARAMRQVVANYVRDQNAQKRGGGRERERISLAVENVARTEAAVDVVELNDALTSLEALDARQGDIATMRIFGGLSAREIAELLGLSTRTVEMDWRMAKAHLAEALALA